MEKQHFLGGVVGGFVAAALLLGSAGDAGAWGAAMAVETAPVPPTVEQPRGGRRTGGLYCYTGPHPVDTRVAAGGPWDETQGAHSHTYPPFDLRLFAFKDGCYYFIGDPKDFGYPGADLQLLRRPPGAWTTTAAAGASWSAGTPTGGVRGRRISWWRAPGSTGTGRTTPFFWSYWPYYAIYYRSLLPALLRRRALATRGSATARRRARRWTAAPPIGRVAAPPARAMPAHRRADDRRRRHRHGRGARARPGAHLGRRAREPTAGPPAPRAGRTPRPRARLPDRPAPRRRPRRSARRRSTPAPRRRASRRGTPRRPPAVRSAPAARSGAGGGCAAHLRRRSPAAPSGPAASAAAAPARGGSGAPARPLGSGGGAAGAAAAPASAAALAPSPSPSSAPRAGQSGEAVRGCRRGQLQPCGKMQLSS